MAISSGLGDYIHYHIFNYRNYGIKKNSGKKNGSFNTAHVEAQQAYIKSHNLLLKQIQMRVNVQNAKNVENELNKLRGDNDYIHQANMELTPSEMTQTEQAIEKIMEEKIDGAQISFTNLTATTRAQATLEKAKNMIHRYSGTDDGANQTQSIKKETIYKRLIQLSQAYQLLSSRIDSKNISSQGITTIQKAMDNINDISQNLLILLNSSNNELIPLDSQINVNNNKTSGRELMKIFNKVRSKMFIPDRNATGDICETGVAALSLLMVGKTYDTIDNFVEDIKTSMVGSHPTTQSFVKYGNGVSLKEMKNLMPSGWTYNVIDSGGRKLTTSSFKKDTVDVIIPITDSAQQEAFGTDTLLYSVKNYNDVNTKSGNIHIIDYALDQTLMLTTSNFANHYLNLLYFCGKNMMVDSALDDMTNEIKFALAVRGLTGAKELGYNIKDQANFFILNKPTEQRFIVRSTQELLQNIGNRYQDDFAIFHNIPDHLEQHWDVTAAQRIQHTLARVHSQILSMSINRDKI